jgi:hypothetical protein
MLVGVCGDKIKKGGNVEVIEIEQELLNNKHSQAHKSGGNSPRSWQEVLDAEQD